MAKQRISWLEVIKSVLSAAFGVQKNKNRVRDFSHGKPLHYIVVGIGFVALLILFLVMVVKTIITIGAS